MSTHFSSILSGTHDTSGTLQFEILNWWNERAGPHLARLDASRVVLGGLSKSDSSFTGRSETLDELNGKVLRLALATRVLHQTALEKNNNHAVGWSLVNDPVADDVRAARADVADEVAKLLRELHEAPEGFVETA